MNPELYICACGSAEHQLIVTKDEDFIYFQVHLAILPWWRRVLHAIPYVLGYRCKHGDFDEIVFDPDSAHKLGATLVSFRRKDDGTTRVGTIEHPASRVEQSFDGL